MSVAGKTGRAQEVLRPLGLLFVAGVLLVGCTKNPQFPDHLKTALMTRADNLRAVRYCEQWFIGGDPTTKNLYGDVFNTSS